MDSFSNAYKTVLDGAIDNSQTTLDVIDVTGKPPSTPFRMRIKADGTNPNEIITVTGVSTNTFTVIRASEPYNGVQTPSAHVDGATIEHILTSGALTSWIGSGAVKDFAHIIKDDSIFYPASSATWYGVTGTTLNVAAAIGDTCRFDAAWFWTAEGFSGQARAEIVDSGGTLIRYIGGTAGMGSAYHGHALYSPGTIAAPIVVEASDLDAGRLYVRMAINCESTTPGVYTDSSYAASFTLINYGVPTNAEGPLILLDYNKTSDDSGTTLPATTWTDIVPNQTFTVNNSDSTVEFSMRSFIQVRDTGAGETFDQARLVIDSAGTPIYEYFGGELFNDNNYHDIHAKGNVYISGLDAGTHTVKVQLLANGGGDFYNRATTSAPFEFFRVQVIEHVALSRMTQSPLLYANEYRTPTDTSYSITDTSGDGADVDATNLVFSFVGPPSGRVMVEFESTFYHSTQADIYTILRDGSGKVSGTSSNIVSANANDTRCVSTHFATVTPGITYNWRWGARVGAGTGSIYGGPAYGGHVTKVWAV